MIGSCWRNASGAICSMATTFGFSIAASGVSVTRLLVARSAGWSTLVVAAESSRRAAAANVHISGDAIGAVGASPAKGSSSALTGCDKATVATSTGFCGLRMAGSAGWLTVVIVIAGAFATGVCATSVTAAGLSGVAAFGAGFARATTDALPEAFASAGVRESANRRPQRTGAASLTASWALASRRLTASRRPPDHLASRLFRSHWCRSRFCPMRLRRRLPPVSAWKKASLTTIRSTRTLPSTNSTTATQSRTHPRYPRTPPRGRPRPPTRCRARQPALRFDTTP